MSDANTDKLTDRARAVLRTNVREAYTTLVPTGSGSVEAGELLHATSAADLFVGRPTDGFDAACVLSALWLWHDYLDESHKISQSIETPNGSLWHAIMHRREGDFGNAKYWYAKCCDHPIFPAMAAGAHEIVARAPLNKSLLKLGHDKWNPPALVDLVQSLHESPSDPNYPTAVALSQMEWRLAFDHCVRGAGG